MKLIGGVLCGVGMGLGIFSSFVPVHSAAWLAFLALGGLLMFIDAEQERHTGALYARITDIEDAVREISAEDVELDGLDNMIKALTKAQALGEARLNALEKNPRDDSVMLKALADLNDKVIRVENRTLPKR